MAEEQKKKAMKTRYENRKTSILKKGKELSTLCDTKVCVIIVSPDGKLETWPNNLNDVKAILSAVKKSGKPIRSENPRKNKGGRGGGDSSSSTIKIPKSVKGKEIDCVVGNNVVDEVLYAVSGADQENNNNNFGTGIPGTSLADMRVNQTPTSHYSYYQWNGNGYIGDMVTNQESTYYGTQFCNMPPNQEPCSPHHCYHQYEMGSSSSSAFNSGLNFSNQEQPSLIAYHHQQQNLIGNNSSALNTTGLNNNLVHPNLAYQQYVMGNSSAFNQEPTSPAYQHYEIWD
nr:agamous-like MADS-box protein AGL81 [Ipomoea batatas]